MDQLQGQVRLPVFDGTAVTPYEVGVHKAGQVLHFLGKGSLRNVQKPAPAESETSIAEIAEQPSMPQPAAKPADAA